MKDQKDSRQEEPATQADDKPMQTKKSTIPEKPKIDINVRTSPTTSPRAVDEKRRTDNPDVQVTTIPLDRIVPGNDMRRHRPADDTEHTALTDSIRQLGVLQPLLVRPLDDGRFEVAAGHRRHRAAKAAGLALVPCIIRTMTDTEVLLVQVAEQLQREDWHPLDESEAYKCMRDVHGMTVERIADGIGKSTRHIHQRLRLLSLAEPLQKAFLAGKINYARARVLARIPEHQKQEKALLEVTTGWLAHRGVGEVQAYINEHYCASLRDAPFELQDSALVPEAGACTDCPYYSLNLTAKFGDNFDDQDRAHVCTRPECLQRKVNVAWERRKAEAEARGQKTLESKNVPFGSYVALDDVCSDVPARTDGKRQTWREVLGPEAVSSMAPVLVRDGHHIADMVKSGTAKAALAADPQIETTAAAQKKSRRQQAANDRTRRQVVVLALERVAAAAERFDEQHYSPLLAKLVVRRGTRLGRATVCKRRGWEVEPDAYGYRDYGAELLRRIPTLSPAEQRALAVEQLAADGWWPSCTGWGDALETAAAELGIDIAALEAEVAKKRKVSTAPKSKPKKGEKKDKHDSDPLVSPEAKGAAVALDRGEPVKWPKGANAVKILTKIGNTAVVLKQDKDTLKNSGCVTAEFGKVPNDRRGHPKRVDFKPLADAAAKSSQA